MLDICRHSHHLVTSCNNGTVFHAIDWDGNVLDHWLRSHLCLSWNCSWLKSLDWSDLWSHILVPQVGLSPLYLPDLVHEAALEDAEADDTPAEAPEHHNADEEMTLNLSLVWCLVSERVKPGNVIVFPVASVMVLVVVLAVPQL